MGRNVSDIVQEFALTFYSGEQQEAPLYLKSDCPILHAGAEGSFLCWKHYL
jgi:hypothetical protein